MCSTAGTSRFFSLFKRLHIYKVKISVGGKLSDFTKNTTGRPSILEWRGPPCPEGFPGLPTCPAAHQPLLRSRGQSQTPSPHPKTVDGFICHFEFRRLSSMGRNSLLCVCGNRDTLSVWCTHHNYTPKPPAEYPRCRWPTEVAILLQEICFLLNRNARASFHSLGKVRVAFHKTDSSHFFLSFPFLPASNGTDSDGFL